jgi:ribonuclease HI
MEKILPTTRSPYHSPKFQTTIASTREESIEMEKQDDADYRIYTDGSGHDENTGAAAVLYKKGREAPIKTLQYHLGRKDEHNSYKAELIGGILGAWLMVNCTEARGKVVSLYTDNQSLLQVIAKIGSKSGQHLVKALDEMVNATHCKLTLRWISGHSEVVGNEKADELAKQAAERKSSRARDLPPKLREPTPVSASAMKESHHKALMAKWNERWSSSPRKARIEEIDNLFPFSRYRKHQQKLTRDQASRMIQVRSRHIPLNAYLHRIGKSQTRQCQQCYENRGIQPPPETVNHYLFECSAYMDEQWEMGKVLERKELKLKNLMDSDKEMRALAKYISKTRRMKATHPT